MLLALSCVVLFVIEGLFFLFKIFLKNSYRSKLDSTHACKKQESVFITFFWEPNPSFDNHRPCRQDTSVQLAVL